MRAAPSLQTHIAEVAEYLELLCREGAARGVGGVAVANGLGNTLRSVAAHARMHEQDFGAVELPRVAVVHEYLPHADQHAITARVPIAITARVPIPWAIATGATDADVVDEIAKLMTEAMAEAREQAART